MTPGELQPHPEGGRYREVFRSRRSVTTASGQTRSALTHIYFSLTADEVSRFHRVSSDEVWNLYQGDGIQLWIWDGSSGTVEMKELSARGEQFCYVVPAGCWQAARPLGNQVLVGCSVAPGFDFVDFELIDPESPAAKQLQSLNPEITDLI